MTPEEIARRHEELPGFQLVDYADVALPLWQLFIEAISVAHKRLAPIQEFVLRSLEVGLNVGELGGFLGLGDDVLEGALSQLMIERLVRSERVADDENAGHLFVLTKEGKRALEEDGTSAPIEEQFVLLFDGIRRSPTIVPADQLSFPKDVSSGSIVEISATPSTKPVVSDLRIEEVERLLVTQSGDRTEFGRTLLRLKRISRYRRVFRKGVALVFRGLANPKELRVKFVIGGIRDEELEQDFAQSGGLSRPGFIRAFSDYYLNANLRKHLGTDISRSVLDGDEVVAKRRALSIAKLKLSAALRKGERPDEDGAVAKETIRSDIATAEKSVLEAERRLSELDARPVACYEQSEFLEYALRNAKGSLTMSSLGLSATIVTSKFLSTLAARLRDGLKFELRLEQLTYERSLTSVSLSKPYIELQKIADQFKDNCHVTLWREARYFHLTFDDQPLLVSNRPLLSYQSKTRTFDQYSGFSVNARPLIDAYVDRVRKLS